MCKPTTVYDADQPCPHGTYNPSEGAQDTASCKSCDTGYYCPYRAATDRSAQCNGGFYCTSNSPFAKPNPALASLVDFFQTAYGGYCTPGQYCPQGASQPVDCDAGFYCPSYLMTASNPSLTCKAGFYCLGKAKVATPKDGVTGNICPAGSYCVEGSINPIKCPSGQYLSYTGAQSANECMLCTPGKYCDADGLSAPKGDCKEGYYCPEGQYTDSPVEYQCPMGYQCPAGSRTKKLCDPGMYTMQTGSSSCTPCGIGKYCSDNMFDVDCDQGTYCPGENLKIQCPLGTFNNQFGQSAPNACVPCDPGYVCDENGLKVQTLKKCDTGYICTGKTQTPKPVTTAQGGSMCIPGQICPQGSSTATPCPAGKYCKEYASGISSGECEAGYYCPEGSTSKNQNICNPGKYCPVGSTQETPCPKGTFSPSYGATTQSDCQPCPAGNVCNQEGINGGGLVNCTEGFYCPAGVSESNPSAYLCDFGYRCPTGTTHQQKCQPGTYQPLKGSSSCSSCPAGYYCDGSDAGRAQDCPLGFYCPEGTKFSSEFPCPAGTYNPSTNKKTVSECLKVPRGYYNDQVGQSNYQYKLEKGTYSLLDGRTSPIGTPCPMFHYCSGETDYPLPCPNGKTTLGEGTADVSECVPCPRGYFCKFEDHFNSIPFTTAAIDAVLSSITSTGKYTSSANIVVFGKCTAGYVCTGGSYTAEPTVIAIGYKCPQGAYCETGAFVETKCAAGKFNDEVGQVSCKNCPEGFYCESIGMTTPTPCVLGHYCPAGSIRAIPCPPGTYYDKTDLAVSVDQCLPCPLGKYCDSWGLDAPSGDCNAGFICVSGAITPTPYALIHTSGSDKNGKCPPGHYCPQGKTTPQPCPIGTYNPNPGQEACIACPQGQYCETEGLTQPTGLCDESYMCEEGSTNKMPLKCDNDAGYCPEGAVKYMQCPDGQTLENDGTCGPCQVGKKCINNKITDCDAPRFCDNTAYPYGQLCLNGTYSEGTGLKDASECQPCPAKEFCVGGKRIDVCNAGFICISGADSPTPHNRTMAYACPRGFYCSPGVSQPAICPLGMFTFEPGAIQQEECDYCKAGYYCEYGEIEPTICPPGNYCPTGSQEPKNCSVTTYNPNEGGAVATDCLPCKGGYYCYEDALSNLFLSVDLYKCPLGNYCPAGTWLPFPCRAGTYADSLMRVPPSTQADCGVCPEHYYCPEQTPGRYNYSCMSGTYCPLGSSWPIICPAGKYCQQSTNSSTGLNQITIINCPEGFYCPMGTQAPIKCTETEICKAGSSFPTRTLMSSSICEPGYYFGYGTCNLCEPGFVCSNNTNTKFPVYVKTEGGYECPPGYYCPRGSSSPTACPQGTYRNEKKGVSLSDCYSCESDSYNDNVAQIACIKCGRGSSSDVQNNFQQCVCTGQFRLWRKSDNQCVCKSGFKEPSTPTIEGVTSTDNQDCLPEVESECPSGTHYDTTLKECSNNALCSDQKLCGGNGDKYGYYSDTAKKCLCKNVDSSAASYCDQSCRSQSLKAFLTKNGQICLQVGSEKECYDKAVFGDSLFLDGMSCQEEQCEITSMKNDDGNMQGSYEAPQVFVDKWRETHPDYRSPYSNSNSKSTNTSRLLQTGGSSSQYINSAIICSLPGETVSFSVSRSHFPVYIIDSLYNTNPDFDSGVFELLENKLLRSNMSISTFMYTFFDEGTYVFGDYENPLTSTTIVKVSQRLCSSSRTANGNIFPLTEENMLLFEISPQEISFKTLPVGLIGVPIAFIILTIISTIVQNLWENKIERDEYEIRMKRAGRRRNFHNIDGKLDKRQYLADLYKLIKDNMDEVTRMINSHDNKESLLKLLKDKTSLINELGEGGKQTVDDLKNQLKTLLEQLRFPDGSTLKELLIQKELQKKLQEKLNKDSMEEAHDDELDIDALERQTDSNEGSEMEDEDESDMLTDALSHHMANNLPDSDDEYDNKKKDVHQRDLEVQRQLRFKREQERRKNDFKDRMTELIDDENDREKLIDGFEDKMRSLDHMLKNENQRQQDNLANKLADRRNRRKKAVADMQERTGELQDKIDSLEDEKRVLQEEMDDVLQNGMKDPQLQKIAEKEKEAALDKLQRQMIEKQDILRQEYMNRLKTATNDKEKERIVEEMQRRLKAVEDELAREKSEQERNLERILLMRQQKRVKKLAHDHQQEIDKKEQQIKELQDKIETEKNQLYVEHGGDIPEILDDQLKDKVTKLVEKSVVAHTTNLDLEKSDLEQLEILKVQQKLELDHAMHAVEKDIEDSTELDRVRMEEDLRLNQQKQREEFNQQISQAKNEKERKKLIQDSKMMEQRIEDEIQNERLRQERLLEEKRKNRKNQRKVKEIEIEQKQMAEIANKETELLQKKYDKLMSQHAETFEKDMAAQVGTLERRGNPDKALLLINQTSNELLEKKLRLLINKQFFELEKYLGTMYNQTALEKMAAKEKCRSRFKSAEEEAYATLTGDGLISRLNQLRDLEKIENEGIELRFKQKEKEEETQIREKLENKFFQERKQLQEDDHKKREELIKGVLSRQKNSDDPKLQDMAQQLLKVNMDKNKDEMDRMEQEKEETMERIKLQIVADNEAEVQQLQKSIEDQMVKEKEMVEQRMKQKRDEVMGEKKRNLESRIQEMSGQLSQFQKDQIMKQFMLELNNLEKAIATERDNQLMKMRQRLIKKKIEAERLKKEESNDKRVQQVKKQIGQYLLAQIKLRRQQIEAAENAKKNKAEANAAGAKGGARPGTNQARGRGAAAGRNTGAQAQQTPPMGGVEAKDQLRMLLQAWNERVKEQQANLPDQQHIWEKRTADLKNDSPRSSVSKMSKITGFQGLGAARGINTTQMGSGQANYTMEELMRRIKRIEKLTEKMSLGKFEMPQPRKLKEAEKAAMSVLDSARTSNIQLLHPQTLHLGERQRSVNK